MNDNQINPLEQFETNDAITLSATLKKKQQFFYVVLQNNEGKIVDIQHYNDYEIALMRGMDKSKETGTFWSIYSLSGKFVDGNFSGR